MTDHAELTRLARRVGATVLTDRDGRIDRINWEGRAYGYGHLYSLICFAERARKIF